MAQKAKPRRRHEHDGTTSQKKGVDLTLGGTIGPMPRYLPPEAKTFWKNAVKWMAELGVAGACDTLHLEAAAMMWYRLRQANKVLVKEGLFQKNKRSGTSTRHPAAVEAIQMTEKLRMWYGEVGFTPAARAALGQGRVPEKGKPDLEAEIFGNGGKKPDLKVG